MSHFDNVSAFMAVGKRFSLDIKIFGFGGRPLYVLQIDDIGEGYPKYESFVDKFTSDYDNLLLALTNHVNSPDRYPSWKSWFSSHFEMHEYHYVERFTAIAELVHLLNGGRE